MHVECARYEVYGRQFILESLAPYTMHTKRGGGRGTPGHWLNLDGLICRGYSFQCQLKEKVLITYLAKQALSQIKI